MEEEKTLTLKSLEKQVKEQFADINKKISELERKVEIIENSLRR
jgi:hypothetical protein